MLVVKFNPARILTDLCDVYASSDTVDAYGQTSRAPDTLLDSGVRCLVSTTTPRSSRPAQPYVIGEYTVFIMPWTGPDDETLTENLWLKIGDDFYNITYVPPPAATGAPLEITVERIKTYAE